jgi:sugar O-acyltransferase (sialic acid O-acetyltransferase NeuD family)
MIGEIEMKKIVIIGSGGFGREVLDLIHTINKSENLYEPVGFIVDPEFGSPGTFVNDLPILGGFDWLLDNISKVFVVVAVGKPNLRFQIINRIADLNVRFINLIHPWTREYISKYVSIGEGVILNGCQISNRTKIGNHVYIHAFSGVGHDTVVSDFVTIGPGVFVDGNVNIGTGCFIGTGSNILPNLSIGEWSVIGAGSAISKNIPANSTAFNAPPRILGQQEPGWHLK